ncbi:MAG: YqeG family HAD IIIA-type phosphatase [Lachnospiraceae bacterium]|nr:YqeG family HAD IIIA-type phosphatase [Lachnospiraceae bacterium]
MFKKFYPKDTTESAYDIDYKTYYEKGYRGILFDIDNTLVPHGAPAVEKAAELFKELKNIGFKVCLISNNSEARVKPFADIVDSPYIYKAGKPSRKNYVKAMEIMGTQVKNSMFVGDQLFTDVYGANRVGMYSILSKPINPKEKIQIVLKRYLEKIVLFFYYRKKKK